MKLIGNILVYGVSFFMFALTIYRLAFFVPPRPQDETYLAYKILTMILASYLSGIIVLMFYLTEYFQTKADSKEE